MKKVFGTFLTGNGSYLPGIRALSTSLKEVSSSYPLVVFATKSVPKQTIRIINSFGLEVVLVNTLSVPQEIKDLNKQFNYDRWNESFSKLEVTNQTQFEKIILLDSDMLVVKNIDHLFEAPNLSAVAAGQSLRPSWIDLNSGLLVIKPSTNLYLKLVSTLNEIATSNELRNYSGIGDQDIFHRAFPNWPKEKSLHLPEEYNMFSFFINPAIKKNLISSEEIAVIHFAINPKPWNYSLSDWLKLLIRQIRYCSFEEFLAFRKYLSFINRVD